MSLKNKNIPLFILNNLFFNRMLLFLLTTLLFCRKVFPNKRVPSPKPPGVSVEIFHIPLRFVCVVSSPVPLLRGPLGRAVVVGAPVRVLRLALGDGLHGGGVHPAAHAVAAAAGRRGDPGAALPGGGSCEEGFRGEAVSVGFGVGAGELVQSGRQQRGGGLHRLPGGLCQEICRRFRSHGALEDLGSRHAVAGIGAASLPQQEQLELLVGGAGLLDAPVDGTRHFMETGWGRSRRGRWQRGW